MEREDGEVIGAIVLAAGEGTRISALTQALYGYPVPKQFAAFGGDRTFLQQTLDRIAPLVPIERTVVVVADHHADLAAAQLSGYQGVHVVHQPRNCGTAAGVLLPLAHLLHMAPDPSRARVVILPSDHHVSRPEVLRGSIVEALWAVERAPAGVALVGAVADRPATGLGWIVPGFGLDGTRDPVRHVRKFVEKPPERTAERLLADGALWNTMVMAANAQALWELVATHAPILADDLELYRRGLGRPGARAELARIYETLPKVDLSRDVLERCDGLAVVRMPEAGWTDCGTPESLFAALAGTEALPRLVSKLSARRATPPSAGDETPLSVS